MADNTKISADKIAENAAAPASVSGDSGSVTQHSIASQIEADRYARAKQAATKGVLGIRRMKVIPPGAV
jgi:hypothetical protein